MTQLGKFDTDRDSALHYLCTSDWANASDGDVESPTGCFWRISNSLQEVQLSNTEITSVLEEWFTQEGDVTDSAEFRASLVGHFIVAEDSNGFVSVAEYPTEQLLAQAFSSLEDIYSEWNVED